MEYLYLILRSFFIYLLMLITIRVLGKKEIGELSVFDLVVILIISDVSSIGIPEGGLFVSSIICLVILILMQKIISFILKKNKKIRDLVDGKESIIIYDGNILYENMKKESYTIDDLICQLREASVMDICEVKLAILETNGTLSVFTKDRYDKIFLPVIESGDIQYDMLKYLNLEEDKLKEMVFNQGKNINEILYASSDGIRLMIY